MPQEGSPTIHVNVRTIRTEEDRQREIERMWSEHAAETERAEAEAAAAAASSSEDEEDQQPLHGATTYDLGSSTTIEYDVVACEDFVEDKGCWVRNMPQEIKDANPHFVPS